MRSVPKRLTLRLVVALTVPVVASRALFGYLDAHRHEQLVLDEMVVGADELTRSITSATWNAMLDDNREAVYRTMEAIGQEHGIESIRLFNKEGRVTFSTDPTDPPQVDLSDEACAICHSTQQVIVRPDIQRRTRIGTRPDGPRWLQIVTPVYNEPACSNAACHAHEATRNVLGVLDIRLDLAGVDRELAAMNVHSLATTVGEIVLIGLFIMFFTRRFVGAPIRKLLIGTRELAAMKLDHPVEIRSPDELGELAASFNAMRTRLKEALDELHGLTHNLEEQVQARTRELQAAQRKLIQGDRLASLGQLAASVAHEINNPVSGVLNLSMVLQRMLESGQVPPDRIDDFRRYLGMITDETTRVGRIVSDLLAFSRRSSPESADVDVNGVVERVITLLGHRLQLGRVEVELELDRALPPVRGDASQLQQVVINLVMNAAEAMLEGGPIRIRTRVDPAAGEAALEVVDEGTGIPPEQLGRIFDPFCSTKEEGKGVGLGLSVVYGIVDAHGGSIDVRSEVGRGTTFEVRLPLAGVPVDDAPGTEPSPEGTP